MNHYQVLHELLEKSALRRPTHIAIMEAEGGQITYEELQTLSDSLRDRLVAMEVETGDRVGICLHKSIDSVATIFGILKSGAAYTPVDPDAPIKRNAFIFSNCQVKVVVTEQQVYAKLKSAMEAEGHSPHFLVLNGTGGGVHLKQTLEDLKEKSPPPPSQTIYPNPENLAYILYTSGSTGKPKGVMLSHKNAISFVNWCSRIFNPQETDRFSSHAPFHFDLSILDIYVPIKHGATLILIGEKLGKDPMKLAATIAEMKITNWYSTPSVLSLLTQYGKLSNYDFSSLKTILFAGEVFPIKHLRKLKQLIPHADYFNLYGPTETNVCTFFKIPKEIPHERTEPYPIGKTCDHLKALVINSSGKEVAPGEEGELCIAGDNVMMGYWNLPEKNQKAFFKSKNGERYYRTGDIVKLDENGDFIFIGRRDRMVKRRGFRVELGEIESALYRHPDIKEVAVIALPDEESGVIIKAFITCSKNFTPSIIDLKGFCSRNLPAYMIPDRFEILENLPKTSTDKIDYQKLMEKG